jgi:hypothetical protein
MNAEEMAEKIKNMEIWEKKYLDRIEELEKQAKPLSDDEIHELANEHLRPRNHDGHWVVLGLEDFARAIEERHGIK